MPGEVKTHLHRLKDSREISAVKQFGNSFPNKIMVLITQANGLRYHRVACISSRAVGGAVQRNRCRRRIRSRVQVLAGEQVIGRDVLFIARRALLDAPPMEVDRVIRSLLEKADLLNND